jgi:hypothetical protein
MCQVTDANPISTSCTPFPNMASGPPMHAGTQECQKEACAVLLKEVNEALFTLVKTPDVTGLGVLVSMFV